MKFFKKKGQAALEFLTTYGWAFLIILVMVGGLSYFGVLDVATFIPDSCKLDGNVECPSYSLKTNNLSIRIGNNLPRHDIEVTKVRLKEVTDNGDTINDAEDAWCSAAACANLDGSGCNSASSVDIDAGREKDIFIDWKNAGVPNDVGNCSVYKYANDKKKFDVEVFYKKGDSEVLQTSTGTMTTKVQV